MASSLPAYSEQLSRLIQSMINVTHDVQDEYAKTNQFLPRTAVDPQNNKSNTSALESNETRTTVRGESLASMNVQMHQNTSTNSKSVTRIVSDDKDESDTSSCDSSSSDRDLVTTIAVRIVKPNAHNTGEYITCSSFICF